MRGVKSIRQLGGELAEKHGVSAEYGSRCIRRYFSRLPSIWPVSYLKISRANNPIKRPSSGQKVIVDAVAYYPENLTVGDVLALGDAS
ncbi:hypothetical protein AD929_11525 [Gluconobacter potus]|uniref:Uncharacterized protein n=1 Tax=Gluconobacter potus TaxID=2724927 RepID=A0A149QSM5_9PROT|nr:hypothetical protein [Gluconobacter potus]KXV00261.1 hypothetical protein AD929_11525 [Gluconobacter potus]